MNTLYLTAEEQKVFASLPVALREGWEAHDETFSSYETPEVLRMRARISPLRRNPLVKDLIENIRSGGTPGTMKLPSLSDEDIGDFFFTVGAHGLGVFMNALLPNIKTDEDVESLCFMAEMRHKILETNASISYL